VVGLVVDMVRYGDVKQCNIGTFNWERWVWMGEVSKWRSIKLG